MPSAFSTNALVRGPGGEIWAGMGDSTLCRRGKSCKIRLGNQREELGAKVGMIHHVLPF